MHLVVQLQNTPSLFRPIFTASIKVIKILATNFPSHLYLAGRSSVSASSFLKQLHFNCILPQLTPASSIFDAMKAPHFELQDIKT